MNSTNQDDGDVDVHVCSLFWDQPRNAQLATISRTNYLRLCHPGTKETDIWQNDDNLRQTMASIPCITSSQSVMASMDDLRQVFFQNCSFQGCLILEKAIKHQFQFPKCPQLMHECSPKELNEFLLDHAHIVNPGTPLVDVNTFLLCCRSLQKVVQSEHDLTHDVRSMICRHIEDQLQYHNKKDKLEKATSVPLNRLSGHVVPVIIDGNEGKSELRKALVPLSLIMSYFPWRQAELLQLATQYASNRETKGIRQCSIQEAVHLNACSKLLNGQGCRLLTSSNLLVRWSILLPILLDTSIKHGGTIDSASINDDGNTTEDIHNTDAPPSKDNICQMSAEKWMPLIEECNTVSESVFKSMSISGQSVALPSLDHPPKRRTTRIRPLTAICTEKTAHKDTTRSACVYKMDLLSSLHLEECAKGDKSADTSSAAANKDYSKGDKSSGDRSADVNGKHTCTSSLSDSSDTDKSGRDDNRKKNPRKTKRLSGEFRRLRKESGEATSTAKLYVAHSNEEIYRRAHRLMIQDISITDPTSDSRNIGQLMTEAISQDIIRLSPNKKWQRNHPHFKDKQVTAQQFPKEEEVMDTDSCQTVLDNKSAVKDESPACNDDVDTLTNTDITHLNSTEKSVEGNKTAGLSLETVCHEEASAVICDESAATICNESSATICNTASTTICDVASAAICDVASTEMCDVASAEIFYEASAEICDVASAEICDLAPVPVCDVSAEIGDDELCSSVCGDEALVSSQDVHDVMEKTDEPNIDHDSICKLMTSAIGDDIMRRMDAKPCTTDMVSTPKETNELMQLDGMYENFVQDETVQPGDKTVNRTTTASLQLVTEIMHDMDKTFNELRNQISQRPSRNRAVKDSTLSKNKALKDSTSSKTKDQMPLKIKKKVGDLKSPLKINSRQSPVKSKASSATTQCYRLSDDSTNSVFSGIAKETEAVLFSHPKKTVTFAVTTDVESAGLSRDHCVNEGSEKGRLAKKRQRLSDTYDKNVENGKRKAILTSIYKPTSTNPSSKTSTSCTVTPLSKTAAASTVNPSSKTAATSTVNPSSKTAAKSTVTPSSKTAAKSTVTPSSKSAATCTVAPSPKSAANCTITPSGNPATSTKITLTPKTTATCNISPSPKAVASFSITPSPKHSCTITPSKNTSSACTLTPSSKPAAINTSLPSSAAQTLHLNKPTANSESNLTDIRLKVDKTEHTPLLTRPSLLSHVYQAGLACGINVHKIHKPSVRNSSGMSTLVRNECDSALSQGDFVRSKPKPNNNLKDTSSNTGESARNVFDKFLQCTVSYIEFATEYISKTNVKSNSNNNYINISNVGGATSVKLSNKDACSLSNEDTCSLSNKGTCSLNNKNACSEPKTKVKDSRDKAKPGKDTKHLKDLIITTAIDNVRLIKRIVVAMCTCGAAVSFLQQNSELSYEEFLKQINVDTVANCPLHDDGHAGEFQQDLVSYVDIANVLSGDLQKMMVSPLEASVDIRIQELKMSKRTVLEHFITSCSQSPISNSDPIPLNKKATTNDVHTYLAAYVNVCLVQKLLDSRFSKQNHSVRFDNNVSYISPSSSNGDIYRQQKEAFVKRLMMGKHESCLEIRRKEMISNSQQIHNDAQVVASHDQKQHNTTETMLRSPQKDDSSSVPIELKDIRKMMESKEQNAFLRLITSFPYAPDVKKKSPVKVMPIPQKPPEVLKTIPSPRRVFSDNLTYDSLMIKSMDGMDEAGIAYMKKIQMPYVVTNGYKYTPVRSACQLYPWCKCVILRSILRRDQRVQKMYCTFHQANILCAIGDYNGIKHPKTGDILIRFDQLAENLPDIYDELQIKHKDTDSRLSKMCDIFSHTVV